MTSKVRLSADRRCRPLSFVRTPGQAADSPRFTAVLERIKVRGPVGRPGTRAAAVAAEWRTPLARRPRLPAQTQDPGGDPGEGRPGGDPEEEGAQGRATRRSWHSVLPRPQHGGTLHRQDQGVVRARHPLRRDPGRLPCRTAPTRRGHQAAQPHTKPSTRRSPRAPTGLRTRSTPGAAGR